MVRFVFAGVRTKYQLEFSCLKYLADQLKQLLVKKLEVVLITSRKILREPGAEVLRHGYGVIKLKTTTSDHKSEGERGRDGGKHGWEETRNGVLSLGKRFGQRPDRSEGLFLR